MTDIGANAKRLTAVVLAVALAAAVAIGAGQERSASAQTNSPLAISKSVHPSPVSAIPVGTHIDYLITEYNNSPYPYPRVTLTDALPAGVEFVSANASQGQCNPMADQPTIYCELGSIPPGNVAHVNIIVRATTPGTYTNVATDLLGNRAAATYTIVPAQSGGTSVRAGGASVTTGSGC
jgi:uncharacterized repeat protein (TIGR01451 family)